MEAKPLSRRKADAVQYIDAYWQTHGRGPSRMDVQLGIKMCHAHLQAILIDLRVAGIVTWVNRKPRTLRVIPKSERGKSLADILRDVGKCR